jgi:hypothetical protein
MRGERATAQNIGDVLFLAAGLAWADAVSGGPLPAAFEGERRQLISVTSIRPEKRKAFRSRDFPFRSCRVCSSVRFLNGAGRYTLKRTSYGGLFYRRYSLRLNRHQAWNNSCDKRNQ